MRLHISVDDGVPIYQQIVKQIRYGVASGRFTLGERLPPVRRLAEDLVVNPNTVARAYRELEAEGVLKTRRGSGVFVAGEGSRLGKEERHRIVRERVDTLLAESLQMGMDVDEVIALLRKRGAHLTTLDKEKRA